MRLTEINKTHQNIAVYMRQASIQVPFYIYEFRESSKFSIIAHF